MTSAQLRAELAAPSQPQRPVAGYRDRHNPDGPAGSVAWPAYVPPLNAAVRGASWISDRPNPDTRWGPVWAGLAERRGSRVGAEQLALQLELCLPRLVSSPAPGGSIDGLRAFSRNPGRRASKTILRHSCVVSLRPTSLRIARRAGVLVVARPPAGSITARVPSSALALALKPPRLLHLPLRLSHLA